MSDLLLGAIDRTINMFFFFFPNSYNSEYIRDTVNMHVDKIEPYLVNLNALFPMDTLFTILSFTLLLELTLLLWSITFKAIQLVRG